MGDTIYEGQYIVNSFYAVNKVTGEQIEPTENGYITLAANDVVVFKDLYSDEYVPVNTIVIFADSETGPAKIQFNNNDLYPFYVGAGEKRGVKSLRVYEMKALNACKIYYEGIVC